MKDKIYHMLAIGVVVVSITGHTHRLDASDIDIVRDTLNRTSYNYQLVKLSDRKGNNGCTPQDELFVRLRNDGYIEEDAEVASQHIEVDWQEVAIRSAQIHVDKRNYIKERIVNI